MDSDLKLLVFAAVLAIATGAIWWRLVKLILEGGRPRPAAARDHHLHGPASGPPDKA